MHQNFIRAAAAAAVAGGFQLTEQSALGLGRAYAGMGVDGTDVSGLYYNPATMTLHTGTQAQFRRRRPQPRLQQQERRLHP